MHYLRLFLRLSRIAHFTTFQKFTDRINYSLLEKIISSFIVISGTKRIFVGIDRIDRIQEGMITHASRTIILREQEGEGNMRNYLMELTYYSKLYVT